MRIVYLHQYFNTPDMSGGTRSYEMGRRLVALGHDVHMVTSWREPSAGAKARTSNEGGMQVHWLPVPYTNHMSYAARMLAFIRFVVAASRIAARIPCDVVFATSTPLTIAIPGVLAARKHRVPMVFEVRDLWPELPIAMGALRGRLAKWAAFALERFAYRNAHHIVALSPGMRDGVVRSGYPLDKVSVIPNSADLELFRPDLDKQSFLKKHPELAGRALVIYAGTIGRINGVDYLVEIAREALASGLEVNFAVVGDGHEAGSVRQAAQAAGVLGRNFFMFPAVAKSQMPEVLAAADLALSLFVDLPAMWANSANKFFDALASGTAVAINYQGWQAEMLRRYQAGLVLPPDDARRAVEQLVEWFAQAPAARVQIGHAARALAEQHFARDVLAQQLNEVLEAAVQNTQQGAG